MKRRSFLKACAGSVTAASLAIPSLASAQPAQMRRVAALILGNADAEAFGKQLREGLAKAGYVEGRNVVLDIRSAEGKLELLPDLAAQLVASRPDVLVALYTPSARAAQQATKEIP